MLMETENKLLKNIFQERDLLLWEVLLRLPAGLSLLRKLHLDSGRRLKTQRGFVQGVLELKEQLDLDFAPELLVLSLDPNIDKGFRICTECTQAVSKKKQNASILRSLVLETIDTMYPEPGRVYIYTDGSLLIESESAGSDSRLNRFVEWAQNEIAVVPDFHKRILFSDEAHFWLNGYVNKQNCRIWSEVNPQVYVETPLHPEKLTVWCALWAGGILLQKR
ncbi:hypothetical protein TNCV_1711111 [Trichonephila clavipes]|nr:hypothetical protein TNCV_1711111 [Trichonephila clavipes]